MASGSGHQPALAITLSENDADEFCGILSCRKQKAPVQIKLKRRILSPLQHEYSLIFFLFFFIFTMGFSCFFFFSCFYIEVSKSAQ
ncbi:hypothetical protein NC652_016734 [Populus alba x Populus x berolinensis]|nr:hypothetical protein NC652_016734 [Populus alba x Populus x berolinensis]